MNKKLCWAGVALASASSMGAYAIPVTGTITSLQMTLSTEDLMAPAEAEFNGLTIGGDTDTGLTITGNMVAFTAGTYVGIGWNLNNGMRQGVDGAGGVIFQGGSITISTSVDGVNFTPFDTVDVSTTNIPFLAGGNGAILPAPNQTTAGMVVNDAGYGTLPGLWDLAFFSPTFNNATGALSLFGQSAGIYMTGSISPFVAPPPGAAPGGGGVVEPTVIEVPTMPLYGLGLTALGLLGVAGGRRKLFKKKK